VPSIYLLSSQVHNVKRPQAKTHDTLTSSNNSGNQDAFLQDTEERLRRCVGYEQQQHSIARYELNKTQHQIQTRQSKNPRHAISNKNQQLYHALLSHRHHHLCEHLSQNQSQNQQQSNKATPNSSQPATKQTAETK
jgi:predicted acylesterase/phospholipase RssA